MSKTFNLTDTLTGRLQAVQPLEPGHVRMYACGPTVYSYAHIGNFRSFLTADLIVRVATSLGWQVSYATNITDVGHLTEDDVADASGEDRMAKALASKEGEAFVNVWDLARHYAGSLLEDWNTLGLREPMVRPRATEHVREQISAIEKLVTMGRAYETSSGVYFAVDTFEGYGKLSGNQVADDLHEGVRDVVRDPEKRNPRDFALWKKDPKHLMQWFSPWGWGFPGWHIECSVMAMKYLGDTIDIHAGGEDLIFPHHECEIAQSESLTGKPFAQHWVHTRFLQVEGAKMSKRLGNFLTVRGIIAPQDQGGRGIDPMALRWALLAGKYNEPYNFTYETLEVASKHVARLSALAAQAGETSRFGSFEEMLAGAGALSSALEAVQAALLEDLNTPIAFRETLAGMKAARQATPAEVAAYLAGIGLLLGVEVGAAHARKNPSDQEVAEVDHAHIQSLVDARQQARRDRDYAAADELRLALDKLGVEVKDTPAGPEWTLRRS